METIMGLCKKKKKKSQKLSEQTACHYNISTSQIAQNGSQSQLPLGLLHFIHKVRDGCPVKRCEAVGAGFIQTRAGVCGQSRMLECLSQQRDN